MPSLLSVTEIANLALDHLDEAPLQSIDDGGTVARWFRRNFWPVAWALMRRHPWNFALARASLPAAAVPPPFGWGRAFPLPGDCLRVLPLTSDGEEAGRALPFKLEGRDILTDPPAPLMLRYVRRIDDTGLFDPLFCEALALTLAHKAAHFVTGKQSYAQALAEAARAVIAEAQVVDALEGTPDEAEADYWIEARQ